MRKREFLDASLIVLIPFLTVATAAAQTWQAAGTLPTGGAPRQYAAGVTANGTIYAIGGTPWQNGGDQDGAVHRLAGGVWSAAAPLGGMGPVVSGAAGIDNLGRIVVFGGFVLGDGGAGEAKRYDPVAGPETNIAERVMPESAVGYFAWARDGQGLLYGFGGGPGFGGPNSGYSDRYNGAADSWSAIAPMPTPAADACAAYDGLGHMLVFGGINAAGNARLANVAQYDIASNTWSDDAIPDLPAALSGARAVLGADGRIYVIGGETGPLPGGTTQAAVYKLELATNTWSPGPSLATPRKWFACALGSDDYIYAIGGANDSGGTNTAEKLFTPRCPVIISQPEPLAAWRGTIAAFSVVVTGAAPFTYQWRKDGVELADGPTGSGSTIVGASSALLKINNPGDADLGNYDAVIANACGNTTSAAAALTLRTPPSPATQWEVTSIHPAWVDGPSYAYAISNGRVGGAATYATPLPDGRVMNLSHPILWDEARVATDITPPGSVGGCIYDIDGDFHVGWFWHTYPCYAGGQWWTCAWQSAGYWSGTPLEFHETHSSGAEYDSIHATDGTRMVGTATYEYSEGNYTSYAMTYNPPNFVPLSLHPAGYSNSAASAVDGAHTYGLALTPSPGPVSHAARWTGAASGFVDLHPAGYSRSSISGAADGQAVGAAYIGDTAHAAMWVGGAFVDLHPPGAASSSLVAADAGIQVGSGAGSAGLWIGTPESFINLGAHLPPGFTAASASDVEVSPNGTVTVVGVAHNAATGNYEAVVWRAVNQLSGDTNCDGHVDFFDIDPLVVALGGEAAYLTAYPDCNWLNADCDGDGDVSFFDIDPFVALIGTNGL